MRGRLRRVQPDVEVGKHVLDDSVARMDVGKDGADKHVAAKHGVSDDLATAQVLDPEAQQAVLLVRLEEGRVGMTPIVGLAARRVDEVGPVTLCSKSETIKVSSTVNFLQDFLPSCQQSSRMGFPKPTMFGK